MIEIFSLEQDPTAELLTQLVALGQGRRAAAIVAENGVELVDELWVGPGFAEGDFQLLAGRNQGLGNESSPEFAESSLRGRFDHHFAFGWGHN